ncbi:MAG TPA: ATP-binding protein [Desulfobacteraceae bacterium]|nr:ATP-binding protein [Desulfobacteraceae bacterium]HPJ67339.1 ATP-binding protein [Desulfobacteraceae bacterium]HPQ28180.1 ATP-binding protein [Desulfobacteraceae bacterium]
MRELSLHILDIIENGIRAGANLITITIVEDHKNNKLKISIADNGHGIPSDMLEKVTDPFYTTKSVRRVGLGLSLFREASRRCEGEFKITSRVGVGTETCATFRIDHIDLAPMGDLESTLSSLIIGNPGVDFIYDHEIDGERVILDTRDIK